MTVIAQNISVGYVSTGTTGPYAFNFPISAAAALRVIQNGTILSPTAYSVVPVNNNYDNGGSVTLNVAAPSGQTVTLQRFTPLTQTSVFTDNTPQPMQQFEAGLDKLTEMIQELAAVFTGGGTGARLVAFSGTPTGTIDGTNTQFIMVNGTAPLTALPTQATVWLNFPLIPGDPGNGYTLALVGGQVVITYDVAPQPAVGSVAADTLFAQGFFVCASC